MTAVLQHEPIVNEQFLGEVLRGLRGTPRRLPCKYFYDKRGSELFDEICRTEEYYVTRVETEILRRHSATIAATIGPDAVLVELGSGSSIKTRLLLDQLASLRAYVPVDISSEHLLNVAEELRLDYPEIAIKPFAADFTERLPDSRLPKSSGRVAVFFPGSTIGNFAPIDARQLLHRIAAFCGGNGGLLVGFDLKKDPSVIEAAYNDAAGVTAEFNLNLLQRVNDELGGDFHPGWFKHEAVYEPRPGRVRISLVSRAPQTVNIGEETFDFDDGESILTEYSHKYTIDEFQQLLRPCGLRIEHAWTDPDEWFAVAWCVRR